MDPIEVGSGITVIGHDEYWKDLISDREFEANFRVFEERFGGQDGYKTIVELPNKK